MSSGRIGRGLFDAEQRWPDAQRGVPDAEYVKKGAEIDDSQAGVSITRLGNGDWFYCVDTTAASRTVTLPSISGELGHHHIVKRTSGGSNVCNIVAEEGTAILDGSATHSIAAQYGVRCYFSDGVAWRGTLSPSSLPLEGAWTSFTPTLSSGTGAFTSASAAGKYIQIGKTVAFTIAVTITTNGTAGGNVQVTPPVTALAAQQSCASHANGPTNFTCWASLLASPSSIIIIKYDGTYPGVNGMSLYVNGVYEAA